MDYHLLFPAEGCGFSNYRHAGLRRPKYEDFEFETYKGRNQICIEFKYY